MVVLILSNTKNTTYFNLLKNCVDSCYDSTCVSDVYVVETNSSLKNKNIQQFINAKFVYPDIEFNYNKFLNIGFSIIPNTVNEILISNNDVVYNPRSIDKLNEALQSYDSACPTQEIIAGKRFTEGYTLGSLLVGWSIALKRSTYERIGGFDEQFTFWYQDNDYANNLRLHNLKHVRVNDAIAVHKCQQSHNLLENSYKHTHGLESLYYNKWGNF